MHAEAEQDRAPGGHAAIGSAPGHFETPAIQFGFPHGDRPTSQLSRPYLVSAIAADLME